jgi:hypothetical protein
MINKTKNFEDFEGFISTKKVPVYGLAGATCTNTKLYTKKPN